MVALARDAVARLSPQVAGRVHLAAAQPAIVVEGDAARLRQVLINLLSNAAKYAPPPTPIEVDLRSDDAEVHLSVRDEGIGIASDELPLLFQRYGRTPTAVEQGIEGLGLGLYLCRAIVERHGGRIWAESPGLGQGTTMHVTVPRRAPAVPPQT
jgi:signal transduction histidine kinase